MFYEAKKIDNQLLCRQCEGKLDIPKILPCGESICSLCETSIQVNDQMFDCLVCKDKHDMPRNGLVISKSMSKILEIKLTTVSRGESYDSLKKMSSQIQKKLNLIKLGINNRTDLVREHCMDLRSDVQLKAEEAIQQVNDISSKIIEEIDEYEKELIEFNKTNKESLDSFNAFVNELESFHTLSIEYLNKNEIDDKLVKKSNEEATNLIKRAELEIENLKSIIFDENILNFEKNNEKLNETMFGTLKTDKMIDFLILSKQSQIKKLFSLCEFPINQKWNLIYRASRDGFEASSFHAKCDSKPNTLIIIKSTNGNVFGGYTEQTWNKIGNNGNHKADPNSFLFSLINKLNKPIKIKWSQNIAICCNSNYGPIFGGGNDLYIADKSNTNITSNSNLGHSYVHPDYAYESNEAKSFLAGSYNFQVSEIEVYTKQ
jgi:hypothetical protein